MENENTQTTNAFELNRQADELLKIDGLDIWGRKKSGKKEDNNTYLQAQFERSMQTGAYRSNSESGRKS